MDRGAWGATVHGGHKESDMTEGLTYKKRLGQGHAQRKKTTWIPWEKIASTSQGKKPQKEVLLTWWSWTCSHQNQEERSFCCVRHLVCGIHYSRLGKWKWIQLKKKISLSFWLFSLIIILPENAIHYHFPLHYLKTEVTKEFRFIWLWLWFNKSSL